MKKMWRLLLLIFIPIFSCKSMLRCGSRRMDRNMQKEDAIRANAEAALRNYYNKTNSITAQKISSINVLRLDDSKDSIKLTFEVNLLKDPAAKTISDKIYTSDTSVWYYQEIGDKVFITKTGEK